MVANSGRSLFGAQAFYLELFEYFSLRYQYFDYI